MPRARNPWRAQRIADERTASAAEAAARAAAAAVAGQIAAGGAAERALLELQGRMAQALREVEGDRWVPHFPDFLRIRRDAKATEGQPVP